LSAYHDSDEYFHHAYFEQRRADFSRADARCLDVVGRLRQVCPALSLEGQRHLDVGCDTGLFLEAFARRHGTVPVGIDVAARAVAAARARGIEAYQTDLADADWLGEFSLITVIDVIEHLADPLSLLRHVKARLRAGGLCYVETPNIRSTVYGVGRWVSNLTGGRPAWLCERLFLPEHVQYFSPEGLRVAAEAAGLRLVAVTSRCLGSIDVNAAAPIKLGVQSLQWVDRVMGREILYCAVLAESNTAPR
jgi:SAM-dependent methyltransferase